ncbi:MAG: hypothetical protein ACRDQ4_05110 [Pseudonocardiaceae bacterium]
MRAALRMVHDWSQRDDATYNTRRELNQVREIVTEMTSNRRDHGAEPDLTALMERLDEMDVHEFTRLSANLAKQVDTHIDRNALFRKLAAGLSLGAAALAISTLEADATQAAPPPTGGDRLAGVWQSRYVYCASSRQGEFIGEHYVVFNQQENHLSGQSLPNSLNSLLALDLSVSDSAVTGTWIERTSPTGYYKGAVYRGAIQLLIDPAGRRITGRWLGFDKESKASRNASSPVARRVLLGCRPPRFNDLPHGRASGPGASPDECGTGAATPAESGPPHQFTGVPATLPGPWGRA